MLPYALHRYWTSVRTSTRATPYSLVYGTEGFLPVEVEIPSLRVVAEAKLDDTKWVRPRAFKEGDLILKTILPNNKDARGKWAPNYEGPYIVKHAFSEGALILANLEGQELGHPCLGPVQKPDDLTAMGKSKSQVPGKLDPL
ncbi:hypothetical protein CR513_21282, partial [Mucuna pruriens]